MLRLIKHQITNNKFLISQLDLGYEIQTGTAGRDDFSRNFFTG